MNNKIGCIPIQSSKCKKNILMQRNDQNVKKQLFILSYSPLSKSLMHHILTSRSQPRGHFHTLSSGGTDQTVLSTWCPTDCADSQTLRFARMNSICSNPHLVVHLCEDVGLRVRTLTSTAQRVCEGEFHLFRFTPGDTLV